MKRTESLMQKMDISSASEWFFARKPKTPFIFFSFKGARLKIGKFCNFTQKQD